MENKIQINKIKKQLTKLLAQSGGLVDEDLGADDVSVWHEEGGKGRVVVLCGEVADEEVGTIWTRALGAAGWAGWGEAWVVVHAGS